MAARFGDVRVRPAGRDDASVDGEWMEALNANDAGRRRGRRAWGIGAAG